MRSNVIFLAASAGGFIRPGNLDTSVFHRALDDAQEVAKADSVVEEDAANHTFIKKLDSLGLAPAGTLTERLAAILEQPYPALDGLDASIIPQMSFTAVGDEYSEVGRTDFTGKTVAYRGPSTEIPMVDTEMATERFPVQHFVCGMSYSEFERASSLNRLMNLVQMKANAVRNVQGRDANERVWNGDAPTGLPGVLNHPWIPKAIDPTNIGGPNTATPDAIIAAVVRAIDFAANATNDVGKSTAVRIASKMYRYMMRTPRSATTDTSILAWIMDAFPGVDFKEAHGLNNVGPNGENAMLCFNGQDNMSLFNDTVQGLTFLAPQQREYSNLVFAHMTWAGVKAFNSHHNSITYFPGID